MQTQMVAQSTAEDTLSVLCDQALSFFDVCFPHIRTLRMTAVGNSAGEEGDDHRAATMLATDLSALGDGAESVAIAAAVKAAIEVAAKVGNPGDDAIGAAGMAIITAHRDAIEQAAKYGAWMSEAIASGTEQDTPPSAMTKMKMRKATDLPISRLMSTLQFRDSLTQRLDHLQKADEIERSSHAASQFWARLNSAHVASWAETLRDSAQTATTEGAALFEAITSGQIGDGGMAVASVLAFDERLGKLGQAVADLKMAVSKYAVASDDLAEAADRATNAVHSFIDGPAADLVDRCWMPETAVNASARTCFSLAANTAAIRDALHDLLPVAEQIEAVAAATAIPMDNFEITADVEAVRDAFATLYTVDIEHQVHRNVLEQL